MDYTHNFCFSNDFLKIHIKFISLTYYVSTGAILVYFTLQSIQKGHKMNLSPTGQSTEIHLFFEKGKVPVDMFYENRSACSACKKSADCCVVPTVLMHNGSPVPEFDAFVQHFSKVNYSGRSRSRMMLPTVSTEGPKKPLPYKVFLVDTSCGEEFDAAVGEVFQSYECFSIN